MATDWQKLHETFLGNANRAMHAWLADHLGVSVESLEALEVGWAPVVQFAKNKGYGWWAIPMRDAAARITGLALRNCEDVKVLYPGSKPGLFYVVNPEHRQGDRGYNPGKGNWDRTSKDRVCPVCDKPDGCLVAKNDAAAICIRNESGRKRGIGWLHILSPEGNVSGASPLPAGEPVITVEGASDVATLYDLGFVGVGRPSNTGGLDILSDLVRGRKVVIIGENDQKADGKWPGKEGAVAALQTCKRTTRDVKMVMPPGHVKDVRKWKIDCGLTAEALRAYIGENGDDRTDHLVIGNDRPSTIIEAFLRDEFMVGKYPVLRRWAEGWYLYNAGLAKYAAEPDEGVIQAFYKWARGKQYTKETPKGPTVEGLRVTRGMVGDVMQAALENTLVRDSSIPTWINGVRGPEAKDLIVFNNGILDVPAFLDGGDDYLLETTPDFFATTALPIAFDPTAQCPEWLRFMDSSLGDDPGKIDLLQEWLGYCMTPDMTFHKMMYLWGVPGSGKSRVMEVLQALVGSEQSVTTSFANIIGPFGLQPLIGKLACLIWDIRVSNNAEAMKGLELLLNISGDDGVQVNRKNVDALASMRLTTRITMASNTLLDIPDTAGASLRRLNIIRFNRSFVANPDTHLFEKLRAEVAGIANWALVGLRRLRTAGKFTVPESSGSAIEEWRIATNPVASFIMECTEISETGYETRGELFDAWLKWAHSKRLVGTSASQFFSAMASIAPQARLITVNNQPAYSGIRLTHDAGRRFLGRP